MSRLQCRLKRVMTPKFLQRENHTLYRRWILHHRQPTIVLVSQFARRAAIHVRMPYFPQHCPVDSLTARITPGVSVDGEAQSSLAHTDPTIFTSMSYLAFICLSLSRLAG